ncbi:MAG: carboxymuconolactone decarboxylase family protein [Gammaproteobacteria bacterium]
MTKFTVHSPDTAPDAARPLLEGAQKAFGGMIPNLYGVMAESPALLEAYQQLGAIFTRTSLEPAEQHIVWITVNFENDCHYCMAAHSAVAKHAGLPDADIDALRTGAPLDDPRHEALRQFATVMVRKRGWPDPADVESLMAAGYNNATILDVILGIGMKTLSNYTNHVADTPVDEAFAKFAWSEQDKIR